MHWTEMPASAWGSLSVSINMAMLVLVPTDLTGRREVHHRKRKSVGLSEAPFESVMVSCTAPSNELTCQWVASCCVSVAPCAAVPGHTGHSDEAVRLGQQRD
jgi:hypothetical protein